MLAALPPTYLVWRRSRTSAARGSHLSGNDLNSAECAALCPMQRCLKQSVDFLVGELASDVAAINAFIPLRSPACCTAEPGNSHTSPSVPRLTNALSPRTFVRDTQRLGHLCRGVLNQMRRPLDSRYSRLRRRRFDVLRRCLRLDRQRVGSG